MPCRFHRTSSFTDGPIFDYLSGRYFTFLDTSTTTIPAFSFLISAIPPFFKIASTAAITFSSSTGSPPDRYKDTSASVVFFWRDVIDVVNNAVPLVAIIANAVILHCHPAHTFHAAVAERIQHCSVTRADTVLKCLRPPIVRGATDIGLKVLAAVKFPVCKNALVQTHPSPLNFLFVDVPCHRIVLLQVAFYPLCIDLSPFPGKTELRRLSKSEKICKIASVEIKPLVPLRQALVHLSCGLARVQNVQLVEPHKREPVKLPPEIVLDCWKFLVQFAVDRRLHRCPPLPAATFPSAPDSTPPTY